MKGVAHVAAAAALFASTALAELDPIIIKVRGRMDRPAADIVADLNRNYRGPSSSSRAMERSCKSSGPRGILTANADGRICSAS